MPPRPPSQRARTAVAAHRCGFTLIELLVVITIIVLLMGLLLPATTLIRQFARETVSRATMRQVDTGLRLFRTDWGTYPGQVAYPALTGGEGFSNRLAYHVGNEIAPADRRAVLADVTTAAAVYDDTGGHALRFTHDMMNGEPRAGWNDNYRRAYATLINRMAREQAGLAMLGGNLWMRGAAQSSHSGTLQYDRTGTLLVPSAAQASSDRPGWAGDYLGGDLDPAYREGEHIFDAWRRPLVYICQVVPGMIGTEARPRQEGVSVYDTRRYGLGPLGFDPSTGPGPDLVQHRPLLLYGGRIALGVSDAGDGQPAPTHGTWFPDAARPMASDRRFYAAPGYEIEFELWSAGRDGRFRYHRDHADNDDNLGAADYDEGLR